MKKLLALCLVLFLFSCKNKDIPDVSGIKVEIPVARFDQAFFALDSNRLQEGLRMLDQQFPEFYTDFMQEILGVPATDSNLLSLQVTREFLRGYAPIFDSLQRTYADVDEIQKDLEKAFRFVKYYFPKYETGKLIFFIGPFDAPGVASTSAGLAVGLQQFAGKDFSVYRSAMGLELFPLYISRRFSKEYILPNCMKAVVEELFPDQSGGRPLIEQMVEKGKQWYLLDKILPETADSLKTGYTQQQLEWCEENEGLIWTHIIRTEDLHSLNPTVIQAYIGEGPFTQGFSQEYSPGNLGQWIGWQIVKKFAGKNPDMKPEELMMTAAGKILDEAKYKPK